MLADAARCEQWEASGGLLSIATQYSKPALLPAVQRTGSYSSSASSHMAFGTSPNGYSISNSHSSWTGQTMPPIITPPAPGKLQLSKPCHEPPITPLFNRPIDNFAGTIPSLPAKPTTPTLTHPWTNAAPSRPPIPMPVQPHLPQPRVERSIRDVNQMKADRRVEIERRCLHLNPPIMPSTLVYMDSFAAAIQIPMALNEGAWEVLRPRLLAQRETAEKREEEQRAANQHLQAQAEERRQQEAQLAEARETLNREWEEMQKPVREKIDNYADEIIGLEWRNGDAVNEPNCPQFAADVLMHVRKRFFELLAHEDAMLMARGLQPRIDSSGETTRKLTLENMKWVFEAKVKPFTDHHRKELFLCSVCDNPGKFYALDAVIQHYAAKHTSSLSMGTAVVYWKAEWPEHPPFDPRPSASRHIQQFNGFPTGATYSDRNVAPMSSLERYNQNSSHNYYTSQDQHSIHNTSPQLQHSAPTRSYQSSAQYQPFPHQSPPLVEQFRAQPESFGFSQHPSSIQHPPRRFYEIAQNQYQPPSSPAFSPYQPYPQVASYAESVLRPNSSLSHAPQYGPPQPTWVPGASQNMPPVTTRPVPLGPPGQPSGIYQVQIEELARTARDIWDRTSGIKDMPSSVRLKVITHHVILKFSERFTNEPNLALFTDALNNNSGMKPIRSLSGLLCKACAPPPYLDYQQTNPREQDGHTTPNLFHDYSQTTARAEEVYALPTLLAHFQSVHVEQSGARAIQQTGVEFPRLDWKFDMVKLPADSIIRELMYASGIDYQKLSLIASVLPNYFPSPLPKIEAVPNPDALGADAEGADELRTTHGHDLAQGSSLHASPRKITNPSTPSHAPGARPEVLEVTVDNFPKFVDSPSHGAPRPTEPAREDEYDPHRPAPAYSASSRVVHNREFTQPRSNLQYEVVRSSEPIETVNNPASYANSSYRLHSSLPQLALHDDGYRVRPLTDIPYQTHDTSGLDGAHSSRSRSRHYSPSRASGGVRDETYGLPPAGIDSRKNDIARPPQETEREPKSSPTLESMNAAEEFLNNFDNIATDAYADHQSSNGKVAEPMTSRRLEEAPQPTSYSDEVSERRVWRPEVLDDGRQSRSAKGTPLEAVPLNSLRRRSRSPDAIARFDRVRDDEYDPRMPPANALRQRGQSPVLDLRTGRSDEQAPSELRYAQAVPPRREAPVYDDYEPVRHPSLQAASAHDLEPLANEKAVYYRQRSPLSRPREVYAPPSPEMHRRTYPVDEPIRYIGAPPPRQIRYVDDQRYVDAAYDGPVEYVRVAPREAPPSARYYVERSGPRELPDEYVGYEGGYREEPVFERNGQLYTRRAPPQHDPYQDPYARPVRYQ